MLSKCCVLFIVCLSTATQPEIKSGFSKNRKSRTDFRHSTGRALAGRRSRNFRIHQGGDLTVAETLPGTLVAITALACILGCCCYCDKRNKKAKMTPN